MIKEVDLAYEELLRLIPITHKSISTSPFVMPNSYGYNKELGIDGQSMNDWYTGSSNTLLKGLVESFVGIEPLFENKIKISPNKLPIDEVNIELTVKKRRIKYHQISSSNNKTCNIMVNGKPLNSEVLDLDQIAEKTIEIQVNY
jgi:cellobiose phosphorylase